MNAYPRGPPVAQAELRPLANLNDSLTTTKPDFLTEAGLRLFNPAVLLHRRASSKTYGGLFMYYHLNLHPEPTLVHADAPIAVVRDDGQPSSGATIPPDEAHARHIACEAARWIAFATERTKMLPATVQQKGIAAACYSTLKHASSLAVPTKLAGTRAHQRRLWAMLRERVPAWTELTLDVRESEIVVLYGDEKIGAIQGKHYGWVRPLASTGARLYLSKITGSERSGYTLGVNVVVGHVGHSLDRLRDLLGEAGYGGDGAAGDRAAEHLRLVSSAPPVAKPHPDTPAKPDPDDVVLTRALDGTARAMRRGRPLPHVRRHSEGFEWHSLGAGASDLAYSVLAALFDEEVARRWHLALKEDVVAAVPYAGGLLRASDLRAWLAAQEARRS